MTTTTLLPESRLRSPGALDVLRLHTVKRRAVFGTPLIIIAAVFVITLIISLALQRSAAVSFTVDLGDGASPEATDGARHNPGIVWALSGFAVAIGVQHVASAFPLSLALGTTRRTFTLGALLTNAPVAAYFTALFLVLLGLELATHHWFVDLHLVDVYVLGAGDVRLLVPIVFLGALALLSIGSAFGASHVRFGARGPAAVGIASALLLATAILSAAPSLVEIAAAFELWWLAVSAVATIVLASAGTLAFLRRASVR